jgi:ABC-type Fe3+-hydroxamate transport system substrate-binding protein
VTSSARVVSLVPSVTETLSAWGHEAVACTRFCERDELPHVGGTKNPDIEAIVALGPDLVVVDAEENRREDAEALTDAGIAVHVLHIRSLADVDEQMPRLAEAVGVDQPPSFTVPREPVSRHLRAVVPIWRRPWMTIGPDTYGASLLRALGVDVVPSDRGDYPTVELDELAALAPDVLLVPDEPYAFTEQHRSELEIVAPVVFVDGKDLFWWGARTPGAIDRLSAVVAAAPTPAAD